MKHMHRDRSLISQHVLAVAERSPEAARVVERGEVEAKGCLNRRKERSERS